MQASPWGGSARRVEGDRVPTGVKLSRGRRARSTFTILDLAHAVAAPHCSQKFRSAFRFPPHSVQKRFLTNLVPQPVQNAACGVETAHAGHETQSALDTSARADPTAESSSTSMDAPPSDGTGTDTGGGSSIDLASGADTGRGARRDAGGMAEGRGAIAAAHAAECESVRGLSLTGFRTVPGLVSKMAVKSGFAFTRTFLGM